MLCFRGLSVARGVCCARLAPFEILAKARHGAARVEAFSGPPGPPAPILFFCSGVIRSSFCGCLLKSVQTAKSTYGGGIR